MMSGRGYNVVCGNEFFGSDFMHRGIGTAIIAVIIIVAIVVIILLFKKSNKNGQTSNEALEILETRFAKGELTEEEFKTKKKALKL